MKTKPKEKKKIVIKPSKKGSFTKIAKKKDMVAPDGTLTEEAIKSGLKSPDPAVRKKAVFAMNARKWAKGKKSKPKGK